MLRQLELYIGEIPLYQAGFLRNRSTEDHIFALRRVTEERWRKGLPTFILSIDLREAFDTVKLTVISDMLLHYGVPCHLVNRIITAVLHERTAVQWEGRRTLPTERNRGVKQGCPFSPYLFVVVLHFVISRISNRLNIDLNYPQIVLPMLLAYADDIIITSDSVSTLETIFSELIAVGLEINEKKCSILVRDPCEYSNLPGDYIILNSKQIRRVTMLKYLGIYMSSSLDRRSTISHRVKMAYKSMHMFVPFLKANKLPLTIIMALYHSVIVPTVLYGLKVATLTQVNRNSLNRMEAYIVDKMRELARDQPLTKDVKLLLQDRTIERKCMVHRL